jgi:ferredoxin
MAAKRILKIWLDKTACAAHEACIIPGRNAILWNDGDSCPTIANDAHAYFDSERSEIIQAIMSCPVAALFLKFEDGKVVSSDDYNSAKGIAEWFDY